MTGVDCNNCNNSAGTVITPQISGTLFITFSHGLYYITPYSSARSVASQLHRLYTP
jgi:hypothetical protein